MAHLWLKNESDQWAVMPLEADGFVLTTNPPRPFRNRTEESASSVLLLCERREGESTWVLICGREREVRVNGVSLLLGVRVVAHRDEISVDGTRKLYFSTESLARIETFTGASLALYCPRCKQSVEREASAVRCPQCRVWYHQSEDLPCWSYAETCALCPQPTALDAGFQWTPEGA
ncbi:MAG TPA: PHD finger domain-containing protein [Pyrinomonadaceae bacterium]|jgi:Zn finger protein HypA/HybF involved in hydrogenase expression